VTDALTGTATSFRSVSAISTCTPSIYTLLARRKSLPLIQKTRALLIKLTSHYSNISGPYAAERSIQIASSLIDLARCEIDMSSYPDVSKISSTPLSKIRPTICFDEWNIWDPERAPGDKGAEETYTLSDALAVAIWLNVFIRNCKDIGMATIAQSVNVISPLMTTETGIVKQTSYWALYLFSKYMRGQAVACHVRAGVYKGETYPEWVQSTMTIPKLDVSAAVEDGWMNVAVVNVDEEKSLDTEFSGIGEGKDVFVYKLGGEKFKVNDTNMLGTEVIGIQESKWDGKGGNFVFEKHSFTLLRWKI
jgi:alpha-N-arabinofuranosidase